MTTKTIFAVLLVAASGSAFAALPFSDDFVAAGPSAGWTTDGAFGTNGTLTTVSGAGETDWRSAAIGVPTGNTDGYIGKLAFAATGYATSWRLAGEETDTNYIIETDIFVPVIATAVEPDDFLYQGVVFYSNSGGYGRVHFQWNTDTGAISNPRIRVQTTTGGFNTPLVLLAPADFTAVEGWHKLKIVCDGANLELSLDGTQIGTTVLDPSHATNGQFGILEYVDGDTGGVARSVYVDNFSVTAVPVILPSTADANWAVYE